MLAKQAFRGNTFGEDTLWGRLLVNTVRLCVVFALTTGVFRADNLHHLQYRGRELELFTAVFTDLMKRVLTTRTLFVVCVKVKDEGVTGQIFRQGLAFTALFGGRGGRWCDDFLVLFRHFAFRLIKEVALGVIVRLQRF